MSTVEAPAEKPPAAAEEPAAPEEPELTSETAAETLLQAKAHIKAKEFDEGIEKLGLVLKYKVEQHGELGPETAPLYYDYGDAVLRKAESCMDLFGGGASKPEAGEQAGEEGAPSEEGDEDDLEIAWENMEVAANIYRQCDDKQLELARVLLRLGDVSQASDDFEKSIEDFQQCLVIREQHLEPHDRRLADVHFSLANSYGFVGNMEKHLFHMKQSLICLELCSRQLKQDLVAVESGQPDPKNRTAEELKAEVKDLDEILEEMQEDVNAEGASQAAIKPAAVAATVAPQTSSRGFDLPSTPAANGPVKVLEARSKGKRKAETAPAAVPAAPAEGAEKAVEPPSKVPRRDEPAQKQSGEMDKLGARMGAGATTVGFGQTTIGF